MQIFLFPIVTILLLSIIAVEDFRSRTIRVIWFILLFIARAAEFFIYGKPDLSLREIGFNWLMLLVISIISISILKMLKKADRENGKMIGAGDYLILFFIGTMGNIYSFLLLLVLLCLITLMVGILLLLVNSNQRRLLPLAGVGAIITSVVIILDQTLKINTLTITGSLIF